MSGTLAMNGLVITQLALLILAPLLTMLAGMASYNRIKRIIAQHRQVVTTELERASKMLVDLRAIQARAASTIRSAERRVKAVGQQINPILEDDEGIDVPDWLVNVARGAGIDPTKALSGDQAELEKIASLLGGGQSQLGQQDSRQPKQSNLPFI